MKHEQIQKYWHCDIPDCEKGEVKIQKFTFTKDDSLRSIIARNFLPPGNYTRLVIGRTFMMSDTPKELRDHFMMIDKAFGPVLVNGLGLGCVLNCLVHKPQVTKITVIEKSKDLIDLMAPHFPQVEIIHADALEYTPPRGERYGAVWHDIWPDICGDNVREMKILHRKYAQRTEWQGSWCRAECERAKKVGL